MMDNEGIRVNDVGSCLLCKSAGEPLYHGLRDRLHRRPGLWGFQRCRECGLMWLNPRPIAEDIGKTYADWQQTGPVDRLYGTRRIVAEAVTAALRGDRRLDLPLRWRAAARLATLFPHVKEMVSMKALGLIRLPPGRLVDVGCGDGQLLVRMRSLGWDVLGVEPDPSAAGIGSQKYGLTIRTATIDNAGLPSGSADAVTLSHVIEHVFDPISLLRDCARLLTEEGQLVVVTPNCQSLGHRLFRQAWLPLEHPRHIWLFTIDTLRTAAKTAGLRVCELRTSARDARGTWWRSIVIRRKGTVGAAERSPLLTSTGWLFQVVEAAMRYPAPWSGEELFMVARRAN